MSGTRDRPRVVIVGGGFGGLYAAQRLAGVDVDVTVVDRRNFHLFQPLLYQVATGGLSPGDISAPLRSILKAHARTRVLAATVTGFDAGAREVVLADGRRLGYDDLIVAAGTRYHYFGNDAWQAVTGSLKTVEDALDLRRRIFGAFEAAEAETDADRRAPWLRFVIVGAGPTGVELAGAIAELKDSTLRGEFRGFDPRTAEVVLLEGGDRVLPPYPEVLSRRARRSLERLGVRVETGAMVRDIGAEAVTYEQAGARQTLATRTTIWAAGMRAESLADELARATGAEQDRQGRLVVDAQLNPPGHPEIFVVGDMAHREQDGAPLPGIAPVAVQGGRHAAAAIRGRLAGRRVPAFRYRDKGQMAVIGRNAAVVDMGRLRFGGWVAWVAWIFVHIAYLIEYDNKVRVLAEWAWSYLTRKRGARLITRGAGGDGPEDARV